MINGPPETAAAPPGNKPNVPVNSSPFRETVLLAMSVTAPLSEESLVVTLPLATTICALLVWNDRSEMEPANAPTSTAVPGATGTALRSGCQLAGAAVISETAVFV